MSFETPPPILNLLIEMDRLEHEIEMGIADINFCIQNIQSNTKDQKIKQYGKSTYYRKINIADSELNINLPIKELFPLLRIVNNKDWPGFFRIHGVKYILKIYKEENKDE